MDKKKLEVVLQVLNNVSIRYSETAQYIKENMKKVSKKENLTVEKVFRFVVFVLMIGL